jgi:hypothetical protein
VENNSFTSHSEEPPAAQPRQVSILPLWLLPLGILLVEAALRLWMPAGFMERTLHTRAVEIVSLPAPRLQIMGDSVTAGINAATLAQAADFPAGSVANYSLPGTSALFTWFALRRELAAGRVPAAVLYAPHPANLETPMVGRFMGRFGTPGECLELLKDGVSPPDWLFGIACRASVAVRDREELRLAVTEGDFGLFETLHTPGVSVAISQIPIPPSTTPPPKPPLIAADFSAQLSAPFFIAELNTAALDRLCDLAQSHGIRVIWTTVPVIGLFQQRAMAGGGAARYQAWLDELHARHPNLSFVHREIEVYPDNCFLDGWHLNRYGALRFSRELGGLLRGSGDFGPSFGVARSRKTAAGIAASLAPRNRGTQSLPAKAIPIQSPSASQTPPARRPRPGPCCNSGKSPGGLRR